MTNQDIRLALIGWSEELVQAVDAWDRQRVEKALRAMEMLMYAERYVSGPAPVVAGPTVGRAVEAKKD